MSNLDTYPVDWEEQFPFVTFTCDGFRPITMRDLPGAMKAAATAFATRQAKREYGRRGLCRTCNENGYAVNGDYANFQAFIGVPVKGELYIVSGRNIWLSVYRK